MHTINHDDALGGSGESYDDQQGVFGERSRQSGYTTPAVEPEGKGGGAAKLFLIAFSLLLVGCVVWGAWKFMSRGGGDDETLSLPVAEASSDVPMTGAPRMESPEIAPAALEQPAPATAAFPTEVGASPQGQVLDAANQSAAMDAALPTAPSVGAAPVVAPAQIAGEPQPKTAVTVVQPAPSSTVQNQTATPVAASATTSDTQIIALTQRVAELERSLAQVRGQLPLAPSDVRATRPATTAAPRRSTKRATAAATRPAAAHAPAGRGEEVKPAATTTTGVALKAVLEGRAWVQLKSGETLTVEPGDEVPGIGSVRSIDAERGEVRLSSGAVLR